MTNQIARIGVLLLIVLGVQISAAQGTTPPSGEIAFTSNRSGSYQIYLMNADGSNVHQLTHAPTDVYDPLWSPDGQKLLYGVYIQGGNTGNQWAIMVIKADGSQLTQIAQLAFPMAPHSLALWSPDSQSLLYVELITSAGKTVQQFHRIKADGTDDQQLDFGSFDKENTIVRLSFTPDGNHLLLATFDSLYTTGLDGSQAHLLTLRMSAPDAFSPDGQSIIGTNKLIDIFKTNSKGNQVKPLFSGLTSTSRMDFQVSEVYQLGWSPNSYYIWGEVAYRPSEGTATAQVTHQLFIGTANGDDYWFRAAADTTLSWSPDSQWIAYTVQDGDHYQVAISQPIGTDQMILTSVSDNSQAAWRPLPAS